MRRLTYLSRTLGMYLGEMIGSSLATLTLLEFTLCGATGGVQVDFSRPERFEISRKRLEWRA